MTAATRTCERCESPLERGDLRCAICSLAVGAEGAARDALEVEVLRCEGCGAAVDYDPEARAPRCAFCDSVLHLERIEDPVEQTELYLPFSVGREAARDAVKSWLGTLGWFRPPDLRERARVERVRPLLWVGWAFDADALVSWTADSDAGARRSAWAPHAGQERMRFDDIVVSASRGLSEEEAAALVPRYDLSTARPEPDAPDDVASEAFDVQRSQARERVAGAVVSLSRSIVEGQHVPGSRTRNVHVAPLLRGLVTRRYAFPAWVMAYRYRGDVYRAVVHGQDERVVVGEAPWSVLRIALAIVGGLVAIGVLVAVAVLAAG
jgi:hypothetical protein